MNECWHAIILSAAIQIWPHQQGEVIVQHYNTLLAMGHLMSHSDGGMPPYAHFRCITHVLGIILSQNDQLQAICERTLNIARFVRPVNFIERLTGPLLRR